MEALLQRTPQLIAAEINGIKDQTRTMMLVNSIEIGRRLTEAKELLPHGEWGTWLETSVEYSQSTANNLMRLYEKFGSDQVSFFGEAKSQALGNLGYTQAVALLGIPDDELGAFMAENNVSKMSTRDLQDKVDEYKERAESAEERAESAEKAADNATKTLETANIQRDMWEKKYDALQKTADAAEKARIAAEKDLEAKKRELEEARKKTPIEPAVVEKTVEKVPDDVQKELDALRRKAKDAETKARELDALKAKEKAFQRSQAILKYNIRFEGVVTAFQSLLASLNEMKASDPDQYEKYKAATINLAGEMTKAL